MSKHCAKKKMLWSFLNQLTVNAHEYIQIYKVLPYMRCYAGDVPEKSQSKWNDWLEKLHSRNITGTQYLTVVLEAYLHNRQAIGRPINPHSWGFTLHPSLGWTQGKAIIILVFFHTETYSVQM